MKKKKDFLPANINTVLIYYNKCIIMYDQIHIR